MTLINVVSNVVLHEDSSLTEEKVCLYVTAGHIKYEFPVLSKYIETEYNCMYRLHVFYGRGGVKQLPRGRRRLKWFA